MTEESSAAATTAPTTSPTSNAATPASPASTAPTTTSTTPATNAAPGGAKPASSEDAIFDATQAPAKTADRPTWLPERFKAPEDLAKSYTELEKAFSEKHSIPEIYDFKAIVEQNKATLDDKHEGFKTLTAEMKANGFSQKQAAWIMSKYFVEHNAMKAAHEAKVAELTPAIAVKAEVTKLQTEFGPKYEDTVAQIANFARANLDPAVVKLLNKSAAGFKFVKSMMDGKLGPVPLRDTAPSSAASLEELTAKRQELMRNKDYSTTSPIGRRLQSQVNELSEQIVKERATA